MSEDVGVKLQELSNFRKIFITSVVTALAFVVGLFWNDAIKSAIEQIVPRGEGLFYKFLAAVIVTVVVVVIVYIIMHGQKLAEKRLMKISGKT